jgi:hypothetical protein
MTHFEVAVVALRHTVDLLPSAAITAHEPPRRTSRYYLALTCARAGDRERCAWGPEVMVRLPAQGGVGGFCS